MIEAAPEKPVLARFWRDYLRRHLGLLLAILGLLAAEGASVGAFTASIEPLFDRVLAPGGQALLWPAGLAILGLFAFRAASSALSRGLIAQVTQRVSARMQADLVAHLLTLDMEFFRDNSPGKLIERVQGDTAQVQAVWVNLLAGVGRDGLTVVFLVGLALSIDPYWTLATLSALPLLALPMLGLQRYVRRKAVQLRQQAGLRATRLDEIFHGIQAVKLFRLEALQTARFARVLTTIRRAEVRLALGRALMPSMLDLTFGAGFLAVLLVAGPAVAEGSRTTGEFMAFFTAIAMVFQPLRRMGEMAGSWQVAAASLGRVYALRDLAPVRRDRAGATVPEAPLSGDLVLAGVGFAHAGQPVLQGVSFTARAGRTTALVGASGAGKSTVFHLLSGLYDPDAGRISLGGTDLVSLPLAVQRAAFATVTQDAALFDESLRDNICLGRPVAPEALARVLALAHVDEFLPRLPLGLDSQVGPRGQALSGGQRQRVALARALVSDAPVLLLDEATSALDPQTEAAVSEALREGARGRTVLVIAHRLSTIRDADWIVVLDKGRVAEEGTHRDLLEKGGRYADLHAMQFRD